jgi:hypothetical protein
MRPYGLLAESSGGELLVGVETLLRWVRTSGLKIRGFAQLRPPIADIITPLSITALVLPSFDHVQLQRYVLCSLVLSLFIVAIFPSHAEVISARSRWSPCQQQHYEASSLRHSPRLSKSADMFTFVWC